MSVSTLTIKGQTTIPKNIRNHLKLKPGDRIDFIVQEDGEVVLKPATLDVRDLAGVLHRPGMKAVSVEDMSRAIKGRFRRK
jgi:AbrB family looped-hinge helix DNA binding protein